MKSESVFEQLLTKVTTMHEVMKIRTTLSNPFIKKKLFQGFFIALTGIIGIVSAGILLSEPMMAHWGLYIYLLGFGLITLGLLPYRKLSRLQNKPNELRIDENRLEFWAKDQCRLLIPVNAIKHLAYEENEGENSIELCLHPSVNIDKKNLTGCQAAFDGRENTIKFLYFSKRSFQEFQAWFK